ncbi:MAG TPA: zinc ribbon domain-containing protein, partial [Stenomitos sp.]
MFAAIRRAIRQLVRKSTHVRHSSINKVSIVILILVDLFVLVNVFNGLDSIARWPLAPQEEFPCYAAYADYRRAP